MERFYKWLNTTGIFVLLIFASFPGQAQRISSFNNIGWYDVFASIRICKNLFFTPEFQWRRTGFITNWQQLFTRAGFQYNFHKRAAAAILYAYTLTYPYGDHPAGPYSIPEHWATLQLNWSNNTGRFYFSHRMRLEMRWIAKIDQKGTSGEVEEWVYDNRFLYDLRTDFPLNHTKMEDKTWYATVNDEIFIGFGKNVNQNVFDQNRFALVVGYVFNKHMRLEGGYFCQILEQPVLVNNKDVFQYNQGPTVNMFLNY